MNNKKHIKEKRKNMHAIKLDHFFFLQIIGTKCKKQKIALKILFSCEDIHIQGVMDLCDTLYTRIYLFHVVVFVVIVVYSHMHIYTYYVLCNIYVSIWPPGGIEYSILRVVVRGNRQAARRYSCCIPARANTVIYIYLYIYIIYTYSIHI